jgi:hypothetical protein
LGLPGQRLCLKDYLEAFRFTTPLGKAAASPLSTWRAVGLFFIFAIGGGISLFLKKRMLEKLGDCEPLLWVDAEKYVKKL